ncbi:hypothetical protein [Bradyrhizobium sp. AZCC 2289]|uniref:hypothetical protein n=1 Tax=Bradyrhizobium sp. AZCC 2289 TaxID=3117026 RepID=UPI002FF1CAEF
MEAYDYTVVGADSRIVAEMLPEPAPSTDEQLIDHMKANGSTGLRQVGTCKVGNGVRR